MTNKEIKSESRGMLKGKWAMAGVVTFIYLTIVGVGGGLFAGMMTVAEELELGDMVYISINLLNYVVAYLVQSAILLGYTNIMMKIATGRNYAVGELFAYVKYTFKVLGLTMLITIYVCLWSLCLIIPGFIKAYSYSMAYYILIDDPSKGINQCITESKEMMKGKKWKLFALLMSFMGWVLVGIIAIVVPVFAGWFFAEMIGTVAYVLMVILIIGVVILLCIGYYALMPYMEVSKAKFYYDLIGKEENYDSE